MRRSLLPLLLPLALAACVDEPAAPLDAGVPADGGDAGGGDAGGSFDAAYLARLASLADLALLSQEPGGSVKYLARVDGKDLPAPLTEDCYFQNMRRFDWHLSFLQSFPGLEALSFQAYQSLVLRAASRRLWGGALRYWPGTRHPASGALGVLAYGVYAEVAQLEVEHIVAVHQRLSGCAPFGGPLLVFVPESPDQKSLVARERANLAARGVATLFPEELVAGVPVVVYSAGEAYGTLRVIPPGERLSDYGPRDVVVAESAPNDISLVAGLITRDPQNELGHVNLRLREKHIPNVALPAVYSASWVRDLKDLLVHLKVDGAGLSINPARLEDAEAFWEAHRPPARMVRFDLSQTELASYEALRAGGAPAYGAKAANLGELHSFLPVEHRLEGFAVPIARYRDFVAAAGIQGELEALLPDPRLRTDLAFKRGALKALRDRIRSAPFDPALLAQLGQWIRQVFGPGAGAQRVRFRSSTNVEDLDDLTGAGIYESRSGCLADDEDGDALGPSACLGAAERADLLARLAARQQELAAHPERTWLAPIIADLQEDLSEEKPVADAVRKVWASLWSERAFDEREYYRIDHRQAFMGLAVNLSFVLETANAVALTNLDGQGGLPLYEVASQIDGEGVARPEDPTAVAEDLTFRRSGDPPQPAEVQVHVWSSLAGEGNRVWSEAELGVVAGLLFQIQDHFATEVYPERRPLSLDVELKRTQDGRVVVKQTRPNTGR